MRSRPRIAACAALVAAALGLLAAPVLSAVPQPGTPSALVFHPFSPHETIRRSLIHDSKGPDGPTSFHGVAEAVVNAVSPDSVDVSVSL
ncbi:MAG: hypothetical protein QOJ39_3862 [Candidatus Eremiobacteraeota bacterium]|jgi:hypothetical protein|nr:hypothetical protein [Candidatus Eremiobacteraeota bacterium]